MIQWRCDEYGMVHEWADGRRTGNKREITVLEEQLYAEVVEQEAQASAAADRFDILSQGYLARAEKAEAEIERLEKHIREAIAELQCDCTCGEAYTSRQLTAPDCFGCWVASGIRQLRAALRKEPPDGK